MRLSSIDDTGVNAIRRLQRYCNNAALHEYNGGKTAPTSYSNAEQQRQRSCGVSMHECVNPTAFPVNDTDNTFVDGLESWEVVDLGLAPRELSPPEHRIQRRRPVAS